jgi:hypothetical protein
VPPEERGERPLPKTADFRYPYRGFVRHVIGRSILVADEGGRKEDLRVTGLT